MNCVATEMIKQTVFKAVEKVVPCSLTGSFVQNTLKHFPLTFHTVPLQQRPQSIDIIVD